MNDPNGNAKDLLALQKQVQQLQMIMEMRSMTFFGQMIDAVNTRKQQALRGDPQARAELMHFCKMFDIEELRAAAMGIAKPT